MELKLLNFNKFMANFSTKLVGGFIAIIVYNYTQNMRLALLTVVIQYALSYIFNLIFKNLLVKKPQLFLFLRIIPIIIYEILLLFINNNPLLCIIGIGVAFSFSYTFKYIPNETLFAYANAQKRTGTGRQMAISKIYDQSALILGILLGGLALDYLDIRILIVASIILYLIGALPLLIYYINNRKNGNVNQEYSTYAHIALKEYSHNAKYANAVSRKICLSYKLYHFLQESLHAMYILLPLLLFTLTGKFTYSAIASAIFECLLGVGFYIADRLDHKVDLTIYSLISGIIVGVMGISLIFVNEGLIWLFYVMVAVMAFAYSIIYFFVYHRMLMKSKIVGRNTTCVINKINMQFLSTVFVVSFGLVFPLWSCFCIGGALSIAGGISAPYLEEKTRRILVDHLEDNEIRDNDSVVTTRDMF